MKDKITLVLALALIASLVIVGCAQPAPAPAPAVPVLAPASPAPAPTPAQPVLDPRGWHEPGGKFEVLDPRGWEPEIDIQALSPRLDTLEGKKVGVINMGGGGADAVVGAITSGLQASIPGCTVEPLKIGRDLREKHIPFVESCDAIILGHNY